MRRVHKRCDAAMNIMLTNADIDECAASSGEPPRRSRSRSFAQDVLRARCLRLPLRLLPQPHPQRAQRLLRPSLSAHPVWRFSLRVTSPWGPSVAATRRTIRSLSPRTTSRSPRSASTSPRPARRNTALANRVGRRLRNMAAATEAQICQRSVSRIRKPKKPAASVPCVSPAKKNGSTRRAEKKVAHIRGARAGPSPQSVSPIAVAELRAIDAPWEAPKTIALLRVCSTWKGTPRNGPAPWCATHE